MPFYGVVTPKFRGVVGSWSECSSLAVGVRGSRYKKFSTERDALNFVAFCGSRKRKERGDVKAVAAGILGKRKRGAEPQYVMRDDGSGLGDLVVPGSSVRYVYTDGACSANGRRGALAGCGVFFGPGDPRNISCRLPGISQTNNRAEMLAVCLALEAYAREPPGHALVIKSDSNYTVKGLREWLPRWKSNGFMLADGRGPVKNQDLWIRLDRSRTALTSGGRSVHIEWIRGHSGHQWNDSADGLATEGCNKPMASTPAEPRANLPASGENIEAKTIVTAAAAPSTPVAPPSAAVIPAGSASSSRPAVGTSHKQQLGGDQGARVMRKFVRSIQAIRPLYAGGVIRKRTFGRMICALTDQFVTELKAPQDDPAGIPADPDASSGERVTNFGEIHEEEFKRGCEALCRIAKQDDMAEETFTNCMQLWIKGFRRPL